MGGHYNSLPFDKDKAPMHALSINEEVFRSIDEEVFMLKIKVAQLQGAVRGLWIGWWVSCFILGLVLGQLLPFDRLS